jgi:hypothetical protein
MQGYEITLQNRKHGRAKYTVLYYLLLIGSSTLLAIFGYHAVEQPLRLFNAVRRIRVGWFRR